MKTDIIITNIDITLTDKNGNKIEIFTPKPELLELWV